MSKRTYVGLDVHLNSIVAVWRRAGEIERRMTVKGTAEGLKGLMKAVNDGEAWAAYEASSCGWEVHDVLTSWGWKVSVLAPTHIAKSVRGRKRKTDVEDARVILNVLMVHGELGAKLPGVWIPGAQIRQDREVVRRRLALGERLSDTKNGIVSLLRMHGVKRPEEIKTAWTRKHEAWLRGLTGEGSAVPRMVRSALASQLRELEFLERENEQLQQEVEVLAEEPRYQVAVRKMTEQDGVGTLTAMTFLAELGDVHRFKNRRQVASYLGLVPTSHESGEAQNRKGHITRMGPGRVRKVLNQAAWALVRQNAEWRGWYERLAYRRGKKKALVAVMRRLGIDLWHRARTA